MPGRRGTLFTLQAPNLGFHLLVVLLFEHLKLLLWLE
jgi:hypothetical protein